MVKIGLTSTPSTPSVSTPAGPISVPVAGTSGITVGGMIDLSRLYPEIGGSINSVRQEIDDAFADAKTFYTREPDEVMRMVSGHSARLSELRVRIYRWEDVHRMWRPVRVREIEPCLEELREQYAMASRLQSSRELDWKMSGGQP